LATSGSADQDRTFLAWPLEVITIYEVNLSVCRKVLEISDEGASKRSENLRELQNRPTPRADLRDLYESST
jgi:hypothetical protein